VKMAAIAAALICLRLVIRGLFAERRDPDERPIPGRIKALTASTLVLWTVAVVAGRLTAYSGVVVLSSIAAFVVAAAVAGCGIALVAVVRARRAATAPAFPLVQPTAANGGKWS